MDNKREKNSRKGFFADYKVSECQQVMVKFAIVEFDVTLLLEYREVEFGAISPQAEAETP